MTPTLPPYPAYKDSGVPWLGQVPEHWEVRRLGSVTHILNGATPSSSRPECWDGHIVWITPDDLGKLKGRYIDNSSRLITQEGYNACGTTLAPAGSIVISTRAPIGHLGILRVAACANQGCRLLVPQAATASEYLYHVLAAARPSLEVLGQGSTFLELSRSKLGIFPIPFPPLPEQAAIVRFLDYMDRRIRRSIRAQQKLIKLLEECRQALIHRAVTGKIDVRTGKPHPAYKDSGVPWLGQVPEHWEVRRSKWLFCQVTRPIAQSDEVVTCFRDGTVTLRKNRRLRGFTEALKELGYQGVRRGDLVIHAMDAFAGSIGVSDSDGKCSPVYVVCQAGPIAYVHYYAHILREMARRGWITALARGIRERSTDFRFQEFAGQLLPLPPLHEQAAIVEYLDAQTAKLDTAIAAARREIELLREYRERLIADVVTGKVDVREVAAQLPEEPPEEEVGTEEEEPVAEELATVDSQEEANGEE